MNKTIVQITGCELLISYKTIVAVLCRGRCYVTSKKHSNTTTRHINDYLIDFPDSVKVIRVSQSTLDRLLTIDNSVVTFIDNLPEGLL